MSGTTPPTPFGEPAEPWRAPEAPAEGSPWAPPAGSDAPRDDRHDTVAMSPEALAALRGGQAGQAPANGPAEAPSTVFGRQPIAEDADAPREAGDVDGVSALGLGEADEPGESEASGPEAPRFGAPEAPRFGEAPAQPAADASELVFDLRPRDPAAGSAGSTAFDPSKVGLGAGSGLAAAGLGAAGLGAAGAGLSAHEGIPAHFGGSAPVASLPGEGDALSEGGEPIDLTSAGADGTSTLGAPLATDADAPAPATGAVATAKKPWYRQKWFPWVAAATALLLVAGIAIPVVLNLMNVQKGDRLAGDYTAALASHDEVWTEERLAAIESVSVASTLGENHDFFSQTASAMTAFTAACEQVQTASTALSELSAAPMPVLAVEDGATASVKYQAAQQQAASLEGRTAAEQALITTGTDDLAKLGEFCLTLPQYNSVFNQYAANQTNVLKPTITLKNGDSITLSGNLKWTCAAAQGCANLYDKTTRLAYADAYEQTHGTFYTTFADLASKQCFLSELKAVCDAYASNWATAGQHYSAAANVLRTTEPTVQAGSALYPGFDSENKAASESVKAGDAAVAAAWQQVDPETAADVANPGWQSRSLKRLLGAHETSLKDLVAAVRAG